ncbi:MAG: MurR/RpiR family transcriptional regulator [Eubacteriales bacterium]|nr:MurR/RpiR family transcriptional regulator [Eubacteriales bacterium]
MKKDFFYMTASKLSSLNDTERNIYDHIIHNMHTVKDESIRVLAHDCFVSTSTMFRFVQKLGFTGYADFVNLLRLTDYMNDSSEEAPEVPSSSWEADNNTAIEESIKNVTELASNRFASLINTDCNVVIVTDGYCYEAARYAKRLLTAYGIRADLPRFSYEYSGIREHLKENDVLWVFSLTVQENTILECVERLRAGNKLRIVSFSDAGNQMLKKISDIFITFTPGNDQPDINCSSLVPLMVGIDRFMYHYRRKAFKEDQK